MTPKHVPLRTCVQCQQVRSKRELIRIVRTPQGAIEMDERGKAAGRGAYVCRNRTCWEGAIHHERLDHALKTKLSAADKKRLLEYGQQLPALPMVSPEARNTQETGPEKGQVLSEAKGRVLSEAKGDTAAATVLG
jgi:predicted RNA-binding protein YlxR (DUF448 family)